LTVIHLGLDLGACAAMRTVVFGHHPTISPL
jgi:hypothetical protein